MTTIQTHEVPFSHNDLTWYQQRDGTITYLLHSRSDDYTVPSWYEKADLVAELEEILAWVRGMP
jgi:hypothetical protein